MPYQLLADAVLVAHFAVVVFVVGGLLAIFIGNSRGWRWVNGLLFRVAHLLAIGVVVLQAWLGRLCPLTILELWLRERAGQAAFEGSFVQHWLERLLYFDLPLWMFTVAYTLFGLLVLMSWFLFPPRRRTADPSSGIDS